MQDESVWIAKAREGSEKAYRLLYADHVSPLYRFLKQFSTREEEVEEWVQRAFIKAFEHLETFDGRSRFSTWLFALAINEMKMDRRRAQIIAFLPLDVEAESGEDDPEAFEWKHMMKDWMTDLDDTKRAVFVLYEVEGYTHAEIGTMLGIAESSSRTLLSRAKKHLQERWTKELGI
jgi:RNA polymerase sigma-70 factor (ECF subfamily)